MPYPLPFFILFTFTWVLVLFCVLLHMSLVSLLKSCSLGNSVRCVQGNSKFVDETYPIMAKKDQEKSSLHLSSLQAPSLGVVSFLQDCDSIFLKHHRNFYWGPGLIHRIWLENKDLNWEAGYENFPLEQFIR